MKKRFAIWTTLIALASIATAASFNIPMKRIYSDADNAKSLGISVQEYKTVWKMGCQLSSDIRHHRPISDSDVEHLLSVARQSGKLANQVMWMLYPLRETCYKSQVIDIAFISSQSKDENEVFTAIELLKHYDDPRWQSLAEAYPWQCKEYRELIMEPRRY